MAAAGRGRGSLGRRPALGTWPPTGARPSPAPEAEEASWACPGFPCQGSAGVCPYPTSRGAFRGRAGHEGPPGSPRPALWGGDRARGTGPCVPYLLRACCLPRTRRSRERAQGASGGVGTGGGGQGAVAGLKGPREVSGSQAQSPQTCCNVGVPQPRECFPLLPRWGGLSCGHTPPQDT